MSKIAVVFKEEIIRLARKEAKSQARVAHNAVTKFRKEVAELKRQIRKAHVEIVQLKRLAVQPTELQPVDSAVEQIRFSAVSVKSQRARLGLSADAFGKLIGVSGQSIYKWEHGTSRPRKAQLAAFVAVRGIGKAEAMSRMEQIKKPVPKSRKKPSRNLPSK